MKKVISILLVAVTVASLMSGCGTQTTAPSTQTPATSTTQPATTPAAVDEKVKAAALNYFASFPEDRHMISVADLFKKIDAGEKMLLIDVRQPDAYAKGHLKGAVNVPYGKAVADALEMIPDDVQIYVNCYTGQTSSQVVALLNIAGKKATNIQGGFDNGISQETGYEAYTSTETATLPTGTYAVEDAIEKAIAKYFTDMEASANKYFNFQPDKLLELVKAGSTEYTILSVRKAEDYAKGHIAGAINIPFGKGMQDSFSKIPTDKPVIVYCYTGQTSSQTMAVLRMLGFDAYSLSGGMGKEGGKGWLGIGGPVVTG